MAEIGTRIRNLRVKKGETLRMTSEAIGVDFSHLSKVETNKSLPSVEVLQKLSEHFDIPVGYFFGEVDDIEDLKTEQNLEFIKDIDLLNISDLLNKYDVHLDGKPLTERELKSFIAWLKTMRELD